MTQFPHFQARENEQIKNQIEKVARWLHNIDSDANDPVSLSLHKCMGNSESFLQVTQSKTVENIQMGLFVIFVDLLVKLTRLSFSSTKEPKRHASHFFLGPLKLLQIIRGKCRKISENRRKRMAETVNNSANISSAGPSPGATTSLRNPQCSG